MSDRPSPLAVEVEELRQQVARVDALHQPTTIPVTRLCNFHFRSPRSSQRALIESCPDCVASDVVECSHRGCCNWPCETHLALWGETKESCTHG